LANQSQLSIVYAGLLSDSRQCTAVTQASSAALFLANQSQSPLGFLSSSVRFALLSSLPTVFADQKSPASVLEDRWACWTTKGVIPVRLPVLSFAKLIERLFARFTHRRASRVSPELCEMTLALTTVFSSEAGADKCVVASSAVAASAVAVSAVAASAVAASAVAACAVAASAVAASSVAAFAVAAFAVAASVAAAAEVVSLPPKTERLKTITI
jgi:hypothetical protein